MLEIENLCKKIGKDLAVFQKLGGIDSQWPFISNEFQPFIEEQFSVFLKDSIEKNALNNLYPFALSQYFSLIHSVKLLEVKDRIKIVKKILEIQKSKRKDYLCIDNAQLIGFDISKYLTNLSNDNLDFSKIKLISSLLFSFYEKIYPTLMRLGYEYHGPYFFNNKKYIVKEYYEMNKFYDPDIPLFPWENLKVIEEYTGDIEIDYFGHLYGDYKITFAFLFIDDIFIDTNEKINEKYNLIQQNYLKLLTLQKNYSVSDYAITLTKGVFYTLNKREEKYKISSELLEKLKTFKHYFPRERLKQRIQEQRTEEIEESITKSYLGIFK